MSGSSIFMRDYLSNRRSSLAIGIMIVLLIHGSVEQDIVFPGENITLVLQRMNVTSATTTTESTVGCAENMILDEVNDTEMFCECVEGYLYYPGLDKCYMPYTRGPCAVGKHFILRANTTMAKCHRNPCRIDNEIPYKGSCYELLVTGGPCSPNETLIISEKSNEPTCQPIQTVTYQVITAPIKPCAPGSRRAGRGLCRPILG